MFSTPTRRTAGMASSASAAAHVAGDDDRQLARAVHQHAREEAEERIGQRLERGEHADLEGRGVQHQRRGERQREERDLPAEVRDRERAPELAEVGVAATAPVNQRRGCKLERPGSGFPRSYFPESECAVALDAGRSACAERHRPEPAGVAQSQSSRRTQCARHPARAAAKVACECRWSVAVGGSI